MKKGTTNEKKKKKKKEKKKIHQNENYLRQDFESIFGDCATSFNSQSPNLVQVHLPVLSHGRELHYALFNIRKNRKQLFMFCCRYQILSLL